MRSVDNMENPEQRPAEPESLDQLRGDCAKMAAQWSAARPAAASRAPSAAPDGIRVPTRSVHLLEGMSDY